MSLWDAFCGRTNDAGRGQSYAATRSNGGGQSIGKPVRCGTKIKFKWDWSDGERPPEIAEGVVAKISTEADINPDYVASGKKSTLRFPFYRVHTMSGEGVYINQDDVIDVIGQNQAIPMERRDGTMTSFAPERVIDFFNSLSGR